MKRLGTYAVLLSMIAAVVVSAGYLRGVRMQRVVPATVPPTNAFSVRACSSRAT